MLRFSSNGFSSSRFARRYSGNGTRTFIDPHLRGVRQKIRVYFFLFLWLLRCFSSPGTLRQPMYSAGDILDFLQDGLPHSDIPGSKVAWDLTETFRTLQRPSSASCVKASTVYSLCAQPLKRFKPLLRLHFMLMLVSIPSKPWLMGIDGLYC